MGKKRKWAKYIIVAIIAFILGVNIDNLEKVIKYKVGGYVPLSVILLTGTILLMILLIASRRTKRVRR